MCFAANCHDFLDHFSADDEKSYKYRDMLVRDICEASVVWSLLRLKH